MSEEFLYKQGFLKIQKGMITFKKHCTLSAPTNIVQVQKVFEKCFISDPYVPIQNRAIPWLGNISFAAVKKVPLLIIASNELNEDPIFIPLDNTLWLREEEDMKRACCFEINIENQALVFTCNSSTAYREWIAVLHNAARIVRATGATPETFPNVAANTSQWLESLPVNETQQPIAAIVSNH